jgi:4-amino-4-deoxy-L-arabinose transferase-like glycosyltransferase
VSAARPFNRAFDLPDRAMPLAVAATFAAAAVLFFTSLNAPLQEPDEVRYAEVSRQMLASQSWLVPVLDGEPYLDKPPLTYWLVMSSYRTFGVHDWSARLVSASTGFLVIVLIWWWARLAGSARVGLTAALLLTLTGRFVYLARMLTPDSVLCVCVLLGWIGLERALNGRRLEWRWWLVSAMAAGLGTLTKGPVAIVLVGMPAFMLCLLQSRRVRPRWYQVVAWAGMLSIVTGPWYLLLSSREPEFVHHFFWRHNITRFVAPFDHAEPFWFYLPGLLLGTLPWCLLVPGFVAWLLASNGNRNRNEAPVRQRCKRTCWRAWRRLRACPPALGFWILAFAWCMLFFSCSGCKRAVYIVPAFPPLTMVLGWSYCRLGSWLHPWRAAIPVFVVLLIGVCFLLPAYAERFSLRRQVAEPCSTAEQETMNVICFPRRWDSVSYYLRRDDVRCFSSEQMSEMYEELESCPATLVFLKPGESYTTFVENLPSSLEFEAAGKGGLAIAGWVRQRQFSLKSSVGAGSRPSGSRTNFALQSQQRS